MPIAMKSEILNLVEPYGPVETSNGIALTLFSMFSNYLLVVGGKNMSFS
jgi:hypothetical protein